MYNSYNNIDIFFLYFLDYPFAVISTIEYLIYQVTTSFIFKALERKISTNFYIILNLKTIDLY